MGSEPGIDTGINDTGVDPRPIRAHAGRGTVQPMPRESRYRRQPIARRNRAVADAARFQPAGAPTRISRQLACRAELLRITCFSHSSSLRSPSSSWRRPRPVRMSPQPKPSCCWAQRKSCYSELPSASCIARRERGSSPSAGVQAIPPASLSTTRRLNAASISSIIGRRGLGTLGELLLGSVSHKVTQAVPCACLTVP